MRRTDPIKHEEKRQEILEAANRCVLRDGLRGASISAICAEARMSPGHLYHYFDGKDAIIEAIARVYLAEFQAQFSEVAGRGTVSSVIAELERVATSAPTGQLLLFDFVTEAGRNAKVAKIVQDNSNAMRSMLEDFIRKGQERGEVNERLDCETAASVLLGLIDAPKLMRVRYKGADLKNSIRMLSTIVENFLAADNDAGTPRRAATRRAKSRSPRKIERSL